MPSVNTVSSSTAFLPTRTKSPYLPGLDISASDSAGKERSKEIQKSSTIKSTTSIASKTQVIVTPSTSPASTSTRRSSFDDIDKLTKNRDDPYFLAMRNIRSKLEEAEERLDTSKKTAMRSLGEVEEAKKCHRALLESITSQNKKLFMLCAAIKADWSISSIEAAAIGCKDYGETGVAILKTFEPIIVHKKALKAIHEAEVECEKLKEAYDNMKEVAKFIMEEDNN